MSPDSARIARSCRSCGRGDLTVDSTVVLDLGMQHLSDFRTDDSRSPRYPLQLVMCHTCSLLQLRHTAPRDELYHERYSFKSGTSEVIRDDLKSIVDMVVDTHQWRPKSWLDIGSNDGTLLSFVPKHIRRVGVDPLAQFADEAREHANQVVVGYFDPKHFTHKEKVERFDVITSISMFYDLDNINRFVAHVAEMLMPGGVWVIQQNYALDMLRDTVFDNICHEHVTYFTLHTLLRVLHRFGLDVIDVDRSPVNGGCLRTVVMKAGLQLPTAARAALLREELEAGVDRFGPWYKFAKSTMDRVDELSRFVTSATADGKRVALYGASTRGATIWQAAQLGAGHFCYAVERQEAKVGRYMSAIGVPIVSEEHFHADHPDFAVVGPWFFRDAIVERERGYLAAGGRLVFPLPKLEVVDG